MEMDPLARELEKAIADYYELTEENKPGFAIIFTLPPGYDEAFWVSNLQRAEGLGVFDKALQYLREKLERGAAT